MQIRKTLTLPVMPEVGCGRKHEWYNRIRVFPDSAAGKESVCNAGDTGVAGLIPGLGGFPRGENGNPF